jgi:hypothetical protein
MQRILFIAALFMCLHVYSQTPKKQVEARLIEQAPVIDGKLDDACWAEVPDANHFVMFEPYSNVPATQRTILKIAYTQYAVYVGAIMYEQSPDSIMKQLSRRDALGQTDFFGITLDPFNDGLTGYTFIVTPANIQYDARETLEEDASWDAVWVSEVTINSNNWTVEMEIPYSMLRFSKKEEQTWGFNAVRLTQRLREKSFWSPIDPKVSGYMKQCGELTGIKGVNPPIRLSLTPYMAGYLLKSSTESDYGYSLRGGMDLKYGITESYTLDMMLIPDFGQVESDNKVLNVTPFETFYEEKRPFFTEGTELFEKGEIFYSRRIGASPRKHNEVEDNLKDNEEVVTNPTETSLYNVTKITGKGKNGLSVGFLNGMGKAMYAKIKDTLTDETTEIKTQPFTNYNTLVVDQSLKNNSHISLINTNFYQPDWDYMANVTATDMRFETPKGKYAFSGIGGYSTISDSTNGYKYSWDVSKINGNFKWSVNQEMASKDFNPNDLGYQDRTNLMNTNARLIYNVYNPKWFFIKTYNNIQLMNYYFLGTNHLSGNSVHLYSFTTFKNYLSAEVNSEAMLGNHRDYYEPRVENRYSIAHGGWWVNLYLSPDYRKPFVVDAFGGFWHAYNNKMEGWWIGFIPIARVNDHFSFNISTSYERDNNTHGYVNKTDNEDTIYYSRRNMQTVTNSANVNFVFSHKSALSLKLRHYWRYIDHKDFSTLNPDGELTLTNNYKEDDVNKNFFNIDMAYTWRFAPGSELSLVWKMAVDHEGDKIKYNYLDNARLMRTEGNDNSISIRVLYYLDYLKVKNIFQKGGNRV